MVNASVELVGNVVLRADGRVLEVSAVTKRILTFVCLHDRGVARDALAAAIWPDTDDGRARANLRAAVWRFQRASSSILELDDHTVALDPRVDVDVIDLRRRAALAIRTQQVDDDLGTHPGLLHELATDLDDEWIDIERERWRQLRLHVLVLRLGALREHGRIREADALAQRARVGAPRHEALLAHARELRSAVGPDGSAPGRARERCHRSGPTSLTTSHSKEPSR